MNTSISRYIVVAVLLAMSGCSYLLEFEECSATADCGPGLICNADRYCVEVAGSTGNITSEPPCCTQETCAEESATAICAPSCACVEPEGATCKVLEGDPTQEGTVLVGSILPTAGDAASIGIPIEQAVQLAVQELNQGGSLGGGRRLALVACDSSGNVDQGKAAAEHLVALGVPAIVGPAFSGIYIEVSDLITSQNDVLILSPSATSPAITSLDDSGLSWRTVPSDVFQSVAIADRVKDLMASAQIERPRVLAFGKGDAYGNGLLGKVTEELAPTLMSDDDFVGSSYPDPGSTPDIDYAAELTPALDALNARPDFVLLLGTNEIINLLSLIEGEAVTRGWSQPPQYILSDGGQVDETVAYVNANPSVAERIEGVVANGKNGELWNSYNRRFKLQFDALGDAGIYTANSYDAAYIIAYAMMSTIGAGNELTGSNIAASMANLVTGDNVETGPTPIGTARTTLLEGGTIDYDGASGPLQFDLTTGDVSSDVILWTLADGNQSFEFADSLFYTIGNDGRGTWGPLP